MGISLTCTCSLCGGLCCPCDVLAGADDSSCNGHGSKDGGSCKCWWSQYWCSAGWLVFFEYFLSARPCSEQNMSIFPCLGQKSGNLCSFLSYLPSNCWQVCSALSLSPLWLSPLLPSFTVLLPGGYSLGSQISFLSPTVHSPCSQVAFWNPTSCSPQSLLMASLHMDSKIQALTTIRPQTPISVQWFYSLRLTLL